MATNYPHHSSAGLGAELDSTVTPHETSPTPPAPVAAGARYTLLEEIARGGMGVVYRAVDTALNREVALKVLQGRFAPGSGTARRFSDEAWISAQLQHPGIPPVHDLGTLEDGRPFLAMKLIKGRTLDDLLRERSDPAQERGRFIAAFEQVCQAVAYAHAHRVIHRDLKPKNIMVGAFGEVQVMDWGLAKVLASGERERPEDDPLETGPETQIRSLRDSDGALTQAGSVLGTPAFMPPEQAAGAIGKVDARSDVFGLGAILAVILTGRPPFVGTSAETTRVKAAQGDLAECYASLASSGADPELIALCRCCLAVKPADRPADAGEVARAVGALRVAAEERARQAEVERERATVREAEGRKRRRVWAGLAGVLALGLAAAVTLALLAFAAQRRAEGETQLASAVKEFLRYDVLQLADPRTQRQDGKLEYDADIRLRDVVLRASGAIEGKFADRPLIEAELRWTIAYTLLGIGRADLAMHHSERVRAIFTQLLGPDHPDTIRSMHNLAMSYYALGQHAEALKLNEEALALCKRRLVADDSDTLNAMQNLALSYTTLGRHAEALKLNEEALALRRQKLGPDHPDTLQSMNNLAMTFFSQGRHAEALKLNEETLALRRQELGPDHPDTLLSMNNLANCCSTLGRHAEALKLNEEALALYKQKLGVDHPDTLASMNNLAISYAALGKGAEALKLREEVLALLKQKFGEDHPDTLQGMNNLAISYAALGRGAEALKLCEEALVLFKQKLGEDHPHTLSGMNNLANCYFAAARHAEALKIREAVLALRRQKLGQEHPDTLTSMKNLSGSYFALGRHAEALKLDEEVLALRRQALGEDHPDTLWAAWGVVESRVAMKQYDQALPEIDALLRLADQATAAGKPSRPDLKPTMIMYRLQISAEKGDAAGYRKSVELHEGLGLSNAPGLYNAACCRAMLAGLLKDRPDEAKQEADRAMDWLRQATAAGWADHAHMLEDTDLDALREREDFRRLMAGLKRRATAELLPPPRER